MEYRIQFGDLEHRPDSWSRLQQHHVAATVSEDCINPAQLAQTGIVEIRHPPKIDDEVSLAALDEFPGHVP